MENQLSRHEPGPLRIDFECAENLSPIQIHSLAGQIIGGPMAPGDIEIDPAGRGWVLYIGDETLTRDELTQTIEWLRQLPGIRAVSWEPIVPPK